MIFPTVFLKRCMMVCRAWWIMVPVAAKVAGINICGKTGTVENYYRGAKQPNHVFLPALRQEKIREDRHYVRGGKQRPLWWYPQHPLLAWWLNNTLRIPLPIKQDWPGSISCRTWTWYRPGFMPKCRQDSLMHAKTRPTYLILKGLSKLPKTLWYWRRRWGGRTGQFENRQQDWT